jgi:ATP-binding cassette subfamily C (CFTR/MRP) protein 1
LVERWTPNILISSQNYLSFSQSFQQYVADRNKYKKTTIEGENPCPMRKSSYLSQLLYFWAEPFVWQGYKNPLTLSDLWDLDSNLTSNELVPKFDDALNPLIEKAKSSKLSITSRSTRRSKDDLANSIEKDLKKGFSVFPALARTFGVSFFVGALMQIMVAG